MFERWGPRLLGRGAGLVCALGLAGLTTPVAAEGCRLALVLAIDISSSVDASEDQLQRQGVAAALLAPEVRDAFLTGSAPVALTVFEWSGRWNQAVLSPWTLIEDEADLIRVSTAISHSVRLTNEFPTAVGYALGYAATLFDSGPLCDRQTLDVSGDGVNNEGFAPAEAYDAFDFSATTVNGLMIDAGDFEGSPELLEFYSNDLRHGPGAFIEIADGFDDFEATLRRKLLRELSVIVMGKVRQ